MYVRMDVIVYCNYIYMCVRERISYDIVWNELQLVYNKTYPYILTYRNECPSKKTDLGPSMGWS